MHAWRLEKKMQTNSCGGSKKKKSIALIFASRGQYIGNAGINKKSRGEEHKELEKLSAEVLEDLKEDTEYRHKRKTNPLLFFMCFIILVSS